MRGRMLRSKRNRIGVVIAIVLALAASVAGAATATATMRQEQQATLLTYAVRAQNNALRYVHTTWFEETYGRVAPISRIATAAAGMTDDLTADTQPLDVLAPVGGFTGRGFAEMPVRSQVSALYATALALDGGTYDPERVGVDRAEALRRTVAWSNALAASYKSDRWACTWQSPLWVYYLSFGAHQVWDSVPQRTRTLIDSAVASEANHLLTLKPRYYRDAKGTVLHEGNSQAEENAWAGTLLLLAASQHPRHPNASAWREQGRKYVQAAHTTPEQAKRDARIAGSNINGDGTVTNHDKINPDYMLCVAETATRCDLLSAETGIPVPPDCHAGLRLVWRSLTSLEFDPAAGFTAPGGAIYRRDTSNRPAASIYYPQGPDWSAERRFNAAEMDVEMWALHADGAAYEFARLHLLATLAQQARHPDSRMFSVGESTLPEEEQFAAASCAEMVARLRVAK
jgi:hypothetical protein